MLRRNKLESLQTKALFSPAVSISPVRSLAAGGLGSLGSLPAVRAGPVSTIAQNRHFASSFTSPDVHMPYSRDSGSGRLGTSRVTDRPAVMVNSLLRRRRWQFPAAPCNGFALACVLVMASEF